MTEETTTEQLAEIEGQAEDTPATEYTPPEGWRVLEVGEVLREGDVIVHTDDATYATARAGKVVQAHQRYIRPIEPEPQQVNDWPSVRDLRHELKTVQTQLGESQRRVTQLEELVGSLRTINEAQEKAFEAAGKQNDALRAQVRILQREADKKNSRIEFLETLNAGNGAAICDYIAKVAKLQGLVDTARGQLETAATEHDSLSTQLAAVKAELASVAADRQRLQIELDAAQQVPADSPELRQLRADLEQVTLGRDTYRDGYERVLSDLKTIRETAKAEAVEAIAEWLEPIRLVDSAYLANATMQHLPQIMRHLTGLDSND